MKDSSVRTDDSLRLGSTVTQHRERHETGVAVKRTSASGQALIPIQLATQELQIFEVGSSCALGILRQDQELRASGGRCKVCYGGSEEHLSA